MLFKYPFTLLSVNMSKPQTSWKHIHPECESLIYKRNGFPDADIFFLKHPQLWCLQGIHRVAAAAKRKKKYFVRLMQT